MENGGSLAVESGESRFGSLEERIRGLTVRIEGLERGTWRMEEKRGNMGSSSDGEEGNGRWKWVGENWWYKVEYQGAVNSRLRRRISRSVKATLEQDTKRWRDGWYQLRSRIEWLEAKKQQGSCQHKLRTSGDLVGFQEREPGFSRERSQFM